MLKICVHGYVTGKVQGVWYRANTQQEAQRLGLTGWVKNLSDGRVEFCICGEQTSVSEMQDWLRQGPPRARVDEVVLEEVVWCEYSDFAVI